VKTTSRIAAILCGALVVLTAEPGTSAGDRERNTTVVRPMINGSFIDAAGGEGAFGGNFALARFEVQQGFLVAVGTLTGTLANSTGTIVGRVQEQVAVPTVVVRSTCQLLHLDVGPLDFAASGLQVHVDKNSLGITRRDGASSTFGDLLCSTARLVAGKPSRDSVAAQLNAVLSKIPSPGMTSIGR
jgi:hypothetical protein